ILSCSNSTSPISVLSGLEHLVGISEFQLSNDGLTDTSELSSLSTLTLLKRLDLSSNSSLSSLPDLSDVSLAILNINATSIVLPDTSESTQLIPNSLVQLHVRSVEQFSDRHLSAVRVVLSRVDVLKGGLSSLETLVLQDMPLTLPSDRYVLPSTIKEFGIYHSPTVQAGFDKNVGYNHLPSLEYIGFGGEDNMITSIESLSENQLSTIKMFVFYDYSIYDGFNDVISEMTSLEFIYLSNCNLQNIPDLSKSADTLTDLYIHSNPDITSLALLPEMGLLDTIYAMDCSISDLSPFALLVAADSTNVSLTELIMNGVSLYDDVAETTSLFDPSILVSVSSISSLGLASLGLVDSDLLSIVHLALD
ncbi:hypothetical protein ADUPG1_002873, partial [Aduncisulcus paluster]